MLLPTILKFMAACSECRAPVQQAYRNQPRCPLPCTYRYQPRSIPPHTLRPLLTHCLCYEGDEAFTHTWQQDPSGRIMAHSTSLATIAPPHPSASTGTHLVWSVSTHLASGLTCGFMSSKPASPLVITDISLCLHQPVSFVSLLFRTTSSST